MLTQEEEAHKNLLKHKFDLYRDGVARIIDHPDFDSRITIEQARRVTVYMHETFFKHSAFVKISLNVIHENLIVWLHLKLVSPHSF